jgi:hypothetical protein
MMDVLHAQGDNDRFVFKPDAVTDRQNYLAYNNDSEALLECFLTECLCSIGDMKKDLKLLKGCELFDAVFAENQACLKTLANILSYRDELHRLRLTQGPLFEWMPHFSSPLTYMSVRPSLESPLATELGITAENQLNYMVIDKSAQPSPELAIDARYRMCQEKKHQGLLSGPQPGYVDPYTS